MTASVPVIRAAWVNRPPEEAFAVFTDEIGAWWPLPTHGLFGDRAGSVCFQDGKLIERAIDGSEAVWGEVVTWSPPTRLVIAWHPGGDAASASLVEVEFLADADGTRVVIEHRGWETFDTNAMHRRRGYVGPNAWGYVLDHFADGSEPRSDVVDTTALAVAYEEFFTLAAQGSFGPPADGHWNADQVLAHVALNDLSMIAVCHSIVHDTPARFENLACHDPDALSRWITRAGDREGLIAMGRATARQVAAAITRLSAEQRAAEVHCHLIHEGELMLDRSMPWEAIAVETQTAMHLPAHIAQLRDLEVRDLQDDPLGDRPL